MLILLLLQTLKCFYQFNERKSPLLNEPSDFAWFEPRARMTSKAFRYEPHRQNQLTQSHRREHWEYYLVAEEWHRYCRDHQHRRDQTEAGEYTRNQFEAEQ